MQISNSQSSFKVVLKSTTFPLLIEYLVATKSLTALSSLTEKLILYLNETSASVASITKSKYPSLVGAIIPLAIFSLPSNTGTITASAVFLHEYLYY